MNAIFDWLAGPDAQTLCMTLLHTLWQGLAWCVLLLVVLRSLADNRPRARYAVSLVCLYGLLFGACLTWSILRHADAAPARGTPALASAAGIDGHEAADAADLEPARTATLAEPAPTVRPPWIFQLALADVVPWLVGAWIVGASVCLLLSSRRVAAVRRLRGGEPIDDPAVLGMLDRLLARLGWSKRIPLLCVDGLASPGVVGVFKPVILIPSSLATGLTPDQWEAILTHELAHIRRWDYLVNLSQLVVESLLFFNPAAWWISRQVRLEREACCDAAVVDLTAQPFKYATLLVDIAARFQPSGQNAQAAAAVSLTPQQSGSLMERVRRIVTPGGQPELTMRRPVAATFLVLSLLVVGLLQTGADVAVAVAANILSDEERVETLAKSAKEIGVDTAAEPLEKVTIRGVIEIEGKTSSKHRVSISASTRRGSHTSSYPFSGVPFSKKDRKYNFKVTLRPGVSTLVFCHPDFAETVAGPYGSNDGPLVDEVHVLLKPGIDVPVTVVDQENKPVADARVSAVPVPNGTTYRKMPTTDKTGKAVLKHINPEIEYSISVTAPGCQRLHSTKHRLNADSTLRFTIARAVPATGVIVDQQGKPVSGATVRQLRRFRQYTRNTGSRRLLGTSDADGRFVLGELEDHWTYDALVEAEGYAPTALREVRAGDKNLRVELVPALVVQGQIIGTKEQIKRLYDKQVKRVYDKQCIRWHRGFPYLPHKAPHERLSIHGRLKINPEGRFTLSPVAPGKLTFWIGDTFTTRKISTSVKDMRLELSAAGAFELPPMPLKRPIRITFARDGENVSPKGVLVIHRRQPNLNNNRTSPDFPIKDGVVETELYVPDTLNLECKKMIGFWFGYPTSRVDVSADEEPLDIEISVIPAGAVKGVVLNADGTPAVDASASVKFRVSYPTKTGTGGFGGGYHAKTNEHGESFISPIPFGAECSISVSRGHYIATGQAFTMKPDDPFPSHTIKLGRAVDARVRLLDPAGKPIAGQPLTLHCRHPKAPMSWGPPTITDRRGECRFDGLNPELKGDYMVEFKTDRDYLAAKFPLKLDGATTVCRATSGKVIYGKLVDAFGKPVPNADFQALVVRWNPQGDIAPSYAAEKKTDAEGRFRFSNLPGVPMRFHGEVWSSDGEELKEVMPESAEKAKPITIVNTGVESVTIMP
jgi:beta-lactamase regulating signal transducer with metallopeptidase domain